MYRRTTIDQKRTVSTRVDDVIRAVVELGGEYPDVVQALQEAKRAGALSSRLEMDALPEGHRVYEKIADDDAKEADPNVEKSKIEAAKAAPASPMPELFSRKGEKDSSLEAKKSDDKPDDDADSDAKPDTKKGFFARMFGG